MFAKRYRLTQAAFKKYFASGRRQHSQYFTVIVAPATQLHVAAVVGKKVSKSAVVRNRLRRQIYGVMKRVIQTSHTGIVIIIAKPAYAKLSVKERRLAVEEELQKVVY